MFWAWNFVLFYSGGILVWLWLLTVFELMVDANGWFGFVWARGDLDGQIPEGRKAEGWDTHKREWDSYYRPRPHAELHYLCDELASGIWLFNDNSPVFFCLGVCCCGLIVAVWFNSGCVNGCLVSVKYCNHVDFCMLLNQSANKIFHISWYVHVCNSVWVYADGLMNWKKAFLYAVL